MNFDLMFFISNARVIFSDFSLFLIDFIRHFRFVNTYRSIVTRNISKINSFHIQNNVQNLPSRHSLNVTKVCRKNCNNSQITNILHNKTNRFLVDVERIDDRRECSFFIIIKKRPKRILIFVLFFCFFLSFLRFFII